MSRKESAQKASRNGAESKPDEKEQLLLAFLRRTSAGEYARVDENLLLNARVHEERETVVTVEEELYYSIS